VNEEADMTILIAAGCLGLGVLAIVGGLVWWLL
jgi:hypothetical protein